MQRLGTFRTVLIIYLLFTATILPGAEASGATMRIISIPKREHGYSNFDSIVIHSASDLEQFLKDNTRAAGMGWNHRAAFEGALTAAAIDFAKESLVLLRHTEGSGSVHVQFHPPQIKGKRIICRIDRKEPEMGTADMAYYGFALAFKKTEVEAVELHVRGREPVILLAVPTPQPAKKDTGTSN